jgi:hypothetical protein
LKPEFTGRARRDGSCAGPVRCSSSIVQCATTYGAALRLTPVRGQANRRSTTTACPSTGLDQARSPLKLPTPCPGTPLVRPTRGPLPSSRSSRTSPASSDTSASPPCRPLELRLAIRPTGKGACCDDATTSGRARWHASASGGAQAVSFRELVLVVLGLGGLYVLVSGSASVATPAKPGFAPSLDAQRTPPCANGMPSGAIDVVSDDSLQRCCLGTMPLSAATLAVERNREKPHRPCMERAVRRDRWTMRDRVSLQSRPCAFTRHARFPEG